MSRNNGKKIKKKKKPAEETLLFPPPDREIDIFFAYFARWAWARAKTLRMSTARVMGPTPPGTGVI